VPREGAASAAAAEEEDAAVLAGSTELCRVGEVVVDPVFFVVFEGEVAAALAKEVARDSDDEEDAMSGAEGAALLETADTDVDGLGGLGGSTARTGLGFSSEDVIFVGDGGLDAADVLLNAAAAADDGEADGSVLGAGGKLEAVVVITDKGAAYEEE